MQIDYMVFGLKDIKLVGCSKNHVLIYLQMSAMKLKTILVDNPNLLVDNPNLLDPVYNIKSIFIVI